MPHYELGPYQGSNYLVGTREHSRSFPTGQLAVIYADSEEKSKKLATKTIGRYLAVGSFAFKRDLVDELISPFTPYPDHASDQIERVISDVQNLLGSITINAYAYFVAADQKVCRFHIETSEDRKSRVLASEVNDKGVFVAMPAEFTFTPYWLAKLITDQY